MTEEKAFELLQDMLNLAEKVRESSYYTVDELCDEIRNRLDE